MLVVTDTVRIPTTNWNGRLLARAGRAGRT